jgi:hypothetical protein
MRLSDVKNNLNKRVKYKGVEYIFESVTVYLDDDGYNYKANVKDISANSSYILTDIASLEVID